MLLIELSPQSKTCLLSVLLIELSPQSKTCLLSVLLIELSPQSKTCVFTIFKFLIRNISLKRSILAVLYLVQVKK